MKPLVYAGRACLNFLWINLNLQHQKQYLRKVQVNLLDQIGYCHAAKILKQINQLWRAPL